MQYSVAIRTLGTSPETLKRELETLHAQTLPPEKIVIYIADGYARPDFTVGREEYVWVKKGMIAQRALQYREINTPLILLLDDDVAFEPDAVERLIGIMKESDADCVACDTFENHLMSTKGKIKAAVSNWVLPHFNNRWAFKLHGSGRFSYINNPTRSWYPSMSAAGPASLWKKDSLLRLHWEDELWLDRLGFAYGDDELEFYKLHLNGGRLVVAFDCGVKNLDAKSASSAHHAQKEKYYRIAAAQLLRWHRIHYLPTANPLRRMHKAVAFGSRTLWTLGLLAAMSIHPAFRGVAAQYVKGLRVGSAYTKSAEYRGLPPFRISRKGAKGHRERTSPEVLIRR